jgi:outer membrane protein, heavy metal efflux system
MNTPWTKSYMIAAILTLVAGFSLLSDAAAQTYRERLMQSPAVQRLGLFAGANGQAPLDALLEEALLNNQELRAASAAAQAARATVAQAGALPDPRLGFTEYLQSVETRVGPQQRAYSLSQSFPWFGTLSARADVQREKAAAAEAAFSAKVLDVLSRVSAAYHEIDFQHQAVHVTRRHVALLERWEEVARARYAAGEGDFAPVIKAQVELELLIDLALERESRLQPLNATLNALLNRGATYRLTDIPHIPVTAMTLDSAELRRRMLEHNPQLRVWDHQARAAENAGRLAGKQGAPGFTLGLNYIQTGESVLGAADSGTDAVMASVSINLPIWRAKYRAAGREAINRRRSADASRSQTVNNLNAALDRALFDYNNAARKLALYSSTLIPRGEQAQDSARALYETGATGFLDLLDAQRALLDFELSLARAHSDLQIHTAEIEALIAGPLNVREH